MRYTTTLMSLVLCAVVPGCGKGGDGKTSSPEESPQSEQAASDSARDACSLLTKEEVQVAYGAPVSTKAMSEGSMYSSCEFLDPARQNMFVMGLEVYWQGGRDQWRAEGLGTAGAERMLEDAEKDVDVGSILQVGPVPGLGDQAVFSPLMGGRVLQGDRLIYMKFGMLEKPDRHFRPLAEKVLTRM